MFTDGNVVQMMEDLKQQDRTLWEKIRQWFQDLAADLKAVVEAYKGHRPDSAEGRMVADMQDVIVILESLYADALQDAGANYQAAGAQKNTTQEGDVKYAIRNDVVDVNGTEYDRVIELDYRIFNRVKRNGKAYIDFIRNNLIKQKITVSNDNGSLEVIEFAGEKERVKKNGAKNKHPVIGELTQARNEIKKLVIVNALETAEISRFAENRDEHSHQWLDENGWENRTSYVMTSDSTIYPVILHIARTRDDRNILYDVNVKINEGIAADKDATSQRAKKQAGQAVRTTKPPGDKVAHTEPNVKEKFSLRDSEGRELTDEQQAYFKDSVIRDKNGNLMPMYHGTLRGGFTVFGGRKDYWYFTNSKKYAYTFEGRKANGQLYPNTKEGVEKGYYSPQRYKVYLNVKNPFITEDADIVEDALYWDKSLAGKLRENGYDALMMKDMSQVIVLHPNQIKNVSNTQPTTAPDIRYSLRDEEGEAAVEAVRKENEKLKEDVQRLRELLKLQRQVTGGTRFTASSVTEAARYLKQAGGIRGNTAEFGKLLNTFYEALAQDREISWENVREYAQPALQWMLENKSAQQGRSEYADEILKELRTSRISLDENQKGEAVCYF